MQRSRIWVPTVLAVSLVGSTVGVAASASVVAAEPHVLVSEVASGGPGGVDDSFIEVTNYGDAPADLDGWRVYNCGATGSRAANPVVEPLSGVTLEPGERFVIAHESSTIPEADATSSTALADDAMGVWLEDDDSQLIDRITVSHPSRDGICGPSVPNTLDFHRGQSYQRVATTGDVDHDFLRAARTPGEPNATEPDVGVETGDVLINELTNGGPDGDADEFIELANSGAEAVDIGGWRLYVCTPFGSRLTSGHLVTVPVGTTIEPDQAIVVAHDSVSVPDEILTLRYATASLSEDGFGLLMEDAHGAVVDAVGVYETDAVYEPAIDSPCTQGTALPDRLDYPSGHTYQRVGDTGSNLDDFILATRSVGIAQPGPEADPAPENRSSGIRISEFSHAPDERFLELANTAERTVALDGWTIHQCLPNGRRALTPLIPELRGVTLAPGETHVAHLADVHIGEAGYGFLVHDEHGHIVDRVGAYFTTSHTAEDTRDRGERYSPCVDGLSLPTFLEPGQSYQRFQDTGDNVRDFVPAPVTPGAVPDDLRAPADIPAEDLEPVDVPSSARPSAPELVSPRQGAEDVGVEVDAAVTARHTTGKPVDVTFNGGPRLSVVENAALVYTGTSATAPPDTRRLAGESRLNADALVRGEDTAPIVTETTSGFPYQRFELVLRGGVPDTFDIVWSGRSTGANEVQLYVWNHEAHKWDLLDAAAGSDGGDITLVGNVSDDTAVRGRQVDVLVQDGPATLQAFSGGADKTFEDPDDYDFALGVLPDSQYLTEMFRDTHADQVQWLVQNADARKIAYTSHVGDLVESWMWGMQMEPRARDEWAFASAAMGVLDEAGLPNGVLPGNHDNKWGRDSDLYNEYFPPSRYQDRAWYAGSWRPGDNVGHYDTLEIKGAKFLIMNIGFVSPLDQDEMLAWASDVVANHPDHNVVVAAHEYIHRNGIPTRPGPNRWTSAGERIWQEVVRPNENVFLVLSGHVSGAAHVVKHDVDGVEGRVVTEMLADYQGFEVDGLHKTGFLRLLQFDLDSKTVSVNTYSPSLDEHNAGEYFQADPYEDELDEFVVPVGLNDVYDKRVATTAFGVVAAEPLGSVVVGDGSAANIAWSGLIPGRRYAWYVDVVDTAGRAARSPLWSFTTAEK